MEIFKKEIKFDNLAEVYVGFKLGIINVDEVLNLIENDKVEDFEANDYSRLIINRETNIKFKSEFEEITNRIIKEQNLVEKRDLVDQYFLLSTITRIWELECLLRKVNGYNTVSNYKTLVLEGVYELFYFFDYPSEWSLNKFILYSMNDNGKSLNQDELYENLLSFVNKEVNYFINRK
ncbi:hypothetical protein ACE1MK_10670 [Tenacibaculum maritimum]|uniref:hypothetical protein n=2 Tax=Tenacibaculum maritimum TaxID=107401 RepID=UPI0012E57081|nr:hypothetical protein [Tenacibaculum maritimum]CAA0186751.1 hypothetical protein USCSP91_200012 [Tenacibaculum maritimum]